MSENSIEFSLSIAERRAVGFIPAWSLAFLQHAQWLLEIDARSTMNNNKMIQVPQSTVCANLNGLINRIYPGIGNSRAQDD